jgi:hypothetical protein
MDRIEGDMAWCIVCKTHSILANAVRTIFGPRRAQFGIVLHFTCTLSQLMPALSCTLLYLYRIRSMHGGVVGTVLQLCFAALESSCVVCVRQMYVKLRRGPHGHTLPLHVVTIGPV